jgi:hypothetical protein
MHSPLGVVSAIEAGHRVPSAPVWHGDGEQWQPLFEAEGRM